MASLPVHRYTPEEYLAIEREAEFRSEYYVGEMFAMAGGSREHAKITMNLSVAIGGLLLGRPCEAYSEQIRVQVGSGSAYVYPDFVTVCGEPLFLDTNVDTLINPFVVIEVLSPSTEAYDRGLKFALYRRIESLREYVLVAQDRMSVELFERQADGSWRMTALTDPSDRLRLSSIDCEISLADIYNRIAFPALDEAAKSALPAH